MRELDNLRHEVTGEILLPVEWSPRQEVVHATLDDYRHPAPASRAGDRLLRTSAWSPLY
jgi:hypothetical protein